MNRRAFSALVLAAAAAAGVSACSMQPSQPSIVDIVASNAQFSTLATAIETAGLADALNGDGPFTVFAPTNAAFDALPAGALDDLLLPENRDTLISILQAHVVAGEYSAADVQGTTSTVTTLAGTPLEIDGTDGVTLRGEGGGAVQVTQPDIDARNGVIHVINGVLLP